MVWDTVSMRNLLTSKWRCGVGSYTEESRELRAEISAAEKGKRLKASRERAYRNDPR